MRMFFRGHTVDGKEHTVVTVLSRTKRIEGITATVVRDVVSLHGRRIEHTLDWYGQDRRGNVWYLGEATRAFDHGQVDTEGSWEVGVHGARAGIVMFAHPRVGREYRQELYRGHAEDQAQVLDLSTQVGVPFGHSRRVRLTEETTALEPQGVELKFYIPGVGEALSLQVSPEPERSALVRVVRP